MEECITGLERERLERYITDPAELAQPWSVDTGPLQGAAEQYPMRVNSYFMGLVRSCGDPIWRQAVPDPLELSNSDGWEDPLAEELLSPTPNLVHRYPDRVLLLVSHECALHCRFCTRKRRWRNPLPMSSEMLEAGLDYIRGHGSIRDVLLSGGDPLLLSLSRLDCLLASLRRIPHVDIIRIGTRVPCALPHAVTPRLAGMLARHHPVYINIHFAHPWEITSDVERACSLLADSGIPLGSQTVLLRGINDSPQVLRELFLKLLRARVRPYYLLQMDLTRGTAHFRTPLRSGLKIMRTLRNHISGLALPHFVVDLPGGKGKVPLLPSYVKEIGKDRLVFRNFKDEICEYPLLPGEGDDLGSWFSTGP